MYGLLRTITGARRKSAAPARKSRRPGLECLEIRDLMSANVVFDAVHHVVTVQGTAHDDVAQVRMVQHDVVIDFSSPGVAHQEVKIDARRVGEIRFFGEAGNDRFENDTAINSLADGGSGNDDLIGGRGRNVLIGGTGTDDLRGGKGDDLVFTGSVFDASKSGYSKALDSVMAEWSRTDASYATRVSHLEHGGGRNGANLLSGKTVHDDRATDHVQGGLGDDCFWVKSQHEIADLAKGEIWVDAHGHQHGADDGAAHIAHGLDG
jgi:Ca2+-binding RTX toxin-like protein